MQDPEAAPDRLAAALSEDACGVVLIGAGVRKDDDHFLLFERLVNSVHEHAPGARIAFNSGLTDTAAAVGRWVCGAGGIWSFWDRRGRARRRGPRGSGRGRRPEGPGAFHRDPSQRNAP